LVLTVTVFLAVISMLSYRRSGIRAIFLTSIALIVLAAGTFAVVLAVIFTDLLWHNHLSRIRPLVRQFP
jgi:hypothetical protein